MPDVPVLRVAHPTNDMQMILRFYRNGEGYRVVFYNSQWEH